MDALAKQPRQPKKVRISDDREVGDEEGLGEGGGKTTRESPEAEGRVTRSAKKIGKSGGGKKEGQAKKAGGAKKNTEKKGARSKAKPEDAEVKPNGSRPMKSTRSTSQRWQ